MAIIECGFPAGLTLQGQTSLSGKDALAMHGPTIMVEIGLDPTLFGTNMPAIPGAANAPALIPPVQVPALIDTGAAESCIDEQLAQQLQLPLINTTVRSGIGGSITLNLYLAHIAIPGLVTEYGQFTGVHLRSGGQFHQALLGRKLLDDIIMVYDGLTGMVRLAR
jgi:predicted aspartyl protease